MYFSSNCADNSVLFPSGLMKKTTKRVLKNLKHDTSKTEITFLRKFKTAFTIL